jgi:intraflagellar transport protein 122
MPEALFNISKFLLTKIQNKKLEGICTLTIIYTLVKQAKLLGANKLTMQLLNLLRGMKISKHLLTQIETWMIAIKTFPYRDPEELLPLCNRCSTYNALLPISTKSSHSCAQCGLKFQYSYVMFGKLNH